MLKLCCAHVVIVVHGVYFTAGKVSTAALMYLSAWLPTVIVVVALILC